MSKVKFYRMASVVVAPLIVLAVSTEASAYSGDQWVDLKNSNSPLGISASMYHVDKGDHFRVYDFHSDGHGVRGYLDVLEGGTWDRIHSSYNGKGTGSYSEFTYDVKSTRGYRMKVCTVDGVEDSTPVNCSESFLFSE